MIRCLHLKHRRKKKQQKESNASFQIHLHLSNSIFWDVLNERIVAALWLKLEWLCIMKSLNGKLHLKWGLYSYHVIEDTFIDDHLTIFREIVFDMETVEVKYDIENLWLILLCSLPYSYTTFIYTILHSHDILTLNEIYDALFSMEQLVVGIDAQVEGFVVRGKTHLKNFGGDMRDRSKSKE